MSLFDFQPNKSIITDAIEEDVRWKKSPTVQGVIEGLKAGVMAAPLGASVQGIRGKNMVAGAIGTGVATGLIMGGLAAAVQKLRNIREEANLRYHAQNMMSREEFVERFRVQASPVLQGERLEKAIETLCNIEQVEDISAVCGLLG